MISAANRDAAKAAASLEPPPRDARSVLIRDSNVDAWTRASRPAAHVGVTSTGRAWTARRRRRSGSTASSSLKVS